MLNRLYKGLIKRRNNWKLQRQYSSLLERNYALKNSQKGKRCFIIGNSPSINNQDLTRLAGEETFVVNAFWFHPQYRQIKPKNYVVIDADAFPDHKTAYVKDEFLKREKELTVLPTRFFFNLNAIPFVNKSKNFSKAEVYYVGVGGHINERLRFNIEIEKLIPAVKNVILGAIIIAAYMGFEEIYLLGCDHDFAAYPYPNYRHNHFYGALEFDATDAAARTYYATGTRGSYESMLDSMKTLFRNYRLVKELLSSTHPNLKIYNASPGSFLDTFPLVKYEEIL